MEPVTKNELLDAFEEDVGDLPLPNLSSINWEVLDYLGWVHPSGHNGYVLLVSPRDGNLRGTVLSRSRKRSPRKHGMVSRLQGEKSTPLSFFFLIGAGTAGSCAPATTKKARSTPARQWRRHVDCALDDRKSRTFGASGHATFATGSGATQPRAIHTDGAVHLGHHYRGFRSQSGQRNNVIMWCEGGTRTEVNGM